MFSNMTYEQYTSAILPKVQGSLNVANALTTDVDFFVMLSSSAAIIGNRGQANYSAANAFLDSFAKYLVRQGIPATSVSLGSVLSVGWLSENYIPVSLSYGTITEERLLAILEYHMDPRWAAGASTTTCHTVAGIRSAADFRQHSLPLPGFMSAPLFSHLMETTASVKSKAKANDVPLSTSLKAAASRNEAVSLIVSAIVAKLSRTMLISPEKLETTRSMVSYGVDSLVAVDLRSWFKKELAMNVTMDVILGEIPMTELAEMATKSSSLVPDSLREAN